MNALGRSSQVIQLHASHTQSLVGVLSRSLFDEPYFSYMVPDENERRSVLPTFLNSVIGASHAHGESYTTPAFEGGAVWIRPDHAATFQQSVRTSLRETNFTLSRSSLRRSIRLSTQLETVRQELARFPYWHLIALGLDPANERLISRDALLQPVLARADSDGDYCYLETLQERSLSFYRQQGFRIEGCGRISESGPRFWAMIRAPERS
jgi:hypothetical protein